MRANIFFTIYLTLYFPLCLAFYEFLGFDYIDEVLTLVLGVYTLFAGVLNRAANQQILKESLVFAGLMTIFVTYSLAFGENVQEAVWLDLVQQVRPYIVIYCTWMLNPKFTEMQKKYIVWMMLSFTLIYAYLFVSGTAGVTINSAEDVVIGQMSLCAAIVWFLWQPRSRFNAFVAIAICAIGILGGKSKFMGEFVVFVSLAYMLKSPIRLNTFKALVKFMIVTAVVLAFTWTKFSKYYIEGFDTTSEIYGKQARPETYKTAVVIMFRDYVPFGSGMGTFATNAAAVHYSPLYFKYHMDHIWGLTPSNPMFVADAYYPVLAEFGIVGLVFFMLFWRRRLREVQRIADPRAYRMGLMCVLALAIESTADTSYLSGKGMGYFMLLAFCLNVGRSMPKRT